MKFERNQPCWCGSGIKYKKCHLNRHEQEPTPRWKQFNILESRKNKRVCLAPEALKSECTEAIIKSHTVPLSRCLKQICEDGHVYGLKTSQNLFKEGQGAVDHELIGIRKASTFTGFCSHHDNCLFSSIEKDPISGAPDQIAALCYRILAHEFYKKSQAIEVEPDLRQFDRGRPLRDQLLIQHNIDIYMTGLRSGEAWVRRLFHRVGRDLYSQNYGEIESKILTFDFVLPFMFSGCFAPVLDINGDFLQNPGNLNSTMEVLTCGSIVYEGKTYVVFAWYPGPHDLCSRFVRQITCLDTEQRASSILEMSALYLENLYYSPKWFDSINDLQLSRIKKLTSAGMGTQRTQFEECIDPQFRYLQTQSA